MRFWVYMLRCADDAFYIGTHRGEDINDRAGQHNAGLDPKAWTFSRRPVTLVWSQEFQRVTDAIAVERQMKGWSRAKKEAVIKGAWKVLPELSARRTHSQGEVAAGRIARRRSRPSP